MRDEVLLRLALLRRRYRWTCAMDKFLELSFVLTAGVAALLLIDRLAFEMGLPCVGVTGRGTMAAAFAAAFGVAAAAGLAWGALRRVTPAAIAWRADRTLSTDERFLTAVELTADGAASRFAPALFVQAAEALKTLDVRRVFPRKPIGYRWGIMLPFFAGTTLGAVAPVVEPAPQADFAFSPERGPAPLTVSFEDASQGRIARWDWEFGDGRVSRERNPAHRFEKPGRYVVRLTVRGPGGHAGRTAEVEAVDPSLPVAEFDAEPPRGRAPLEVRFANRSHRAEVSRWRFGDGGVSTVRNPTHVYETPGVFEAELEAHNAMGSSSRKRPIKVVGPDAPLADFAAWPRKGPAPLVVNFEDRSTGKVTEWEWDVGDLAVGPDRIRRERMPSHVYHFPGKYTVRLKVKGPGGEDVLTRARYIEVESDGQSGGGGGGQAGGGRGGGGGGAGKGAGGAGAQEGRLFGDPAERPKAEFTPETVKGQPRPGELVEKVKSVYGKGGQGEHGQERPYDIETFGEYQRAAEDSMNRERIPPSLREYVKKYFEEIRPK